MANKCHFVVKYQIRQLSSNITYHVAWTYALRLLTRFSECMTNFGWSRVRRLIMLLDEAKESPFCYSIAAVITSNVTIHQTRHFDSQASFLLRKATSLTVNLIQKNDRRLIFTGVI